jgi:hypothetical protein
MTADKPSLCRNTSSWSSSSPRSRPALEAWDGFACSRAPRNSMRTKCARGGCESRRMNLRCMGTRADLRAMRMDSGRFDAMEFRGCRKTAGWAGRDDCCTVLQNSRGRTPPPFQRNGEEELGKGGKGGGKRCYDMRRPSGAMRVLGNNAGSDSTLHFLPSECRN